LLEPSRWPVAFVFLEIDPADVDVNVHPTKIEVRFRDGQLVHGEMLAALRETLNRANLTPGAALAEPDEPAPAGQEQRRASLRQALADFFKSTPTPQPRLDFHQSAPHTAAPTVGTARGDAPLRRPATVPATPMPQASERLGPVAEPTVEPPPAPALPTREAIQIHNTYIVAPCEDGLLIVDQHALHERLLYNDLRRRFAAGTLTGQRLLIPETLRVTPAEADAIDRHAALLGKLGVEVVSFGPDTFALQQFPTVLAERNVAPLEFLREVLDRLADDETTDSERLLADLLQTLACRAAVKAGDPLTAAEIDALLDRREEAEKHSACPHGRPTSLKLTVRDLEKQFRRT
jgi:DNA mismatch repair protein MutL